MLKSCTVQSFIEVAGAAIRSVRRINGEPAADTVFSPDTPWPRGSLLNFLWSIQDFRFPSLSALSKGLPTAAASSSCPAASSTSWEDTAGGRAGRLSTGGTWTSSAKWARPAGSAWRRTASASPPPGGCVRPQHARRAGRVPGGGVAEGRVAVTNGPGA